MRYVRAAAIFLMLLVCAFSVAAQQKESAEAGKPAEKGAQTTEKSGKLPADAEKAAAAKEEPPIVTHHEIRVGDRALHYTATTGYMPIRNEEGTRTEERRVGKECRSR